MSTRRNERSWWLVVLICGCVSSCERSTFETEPQPPSPTTAQRKLRPLDHATIIGQRILTELRALKPDLQFTAVDCPKPLDPIPDKQVTCIVRHADNVDRPVGVMITSRRGDFRWGRKHAGTSLDKRVHGLLRDRWPALTRVLCPADVVAYKGAKTVCRVESARVPTERVLVRWQTRLGKFTVHRLADVVALKRRMALEIGKRGDKVKSVSCPDLIPLIRGVVFECIAQLSDGTSLVVPVHSERGKATIGLPKKPTSTAPSKNNK